MKKSKRNQNPIFRKSYSKCPDVALCIRPRDYNFSKHHKDRHQKIVVKYERGGIIREYHRSSDNAGRYECGCGFVTISNNSMTKHVNVCPNSNRFCNSRHHLSQVAREGSASTEVSSFSEVEDDESTIEDLFIMIRNDIKESKSLTKKLQRSIARRLKTKNST